MTLREGTLLLGGRYRITRFISSGGFGCTYEGEHTMLGKRVAIKEFFVRSICNRDSDTGCVSIGAESQRGLIDKLRKKFIDEARALGKMKHPCIVDVQDVFEDNGTAYFVMDFIDGRSVDDIIKKQGPLSEEKALEYIDRLCDALEYVHDKKRLHLDVKPANIMVDRRGDVVLIDFGASKQYDEANGENTSTLIGRTPGFAPVEQMGNDVGKFTPATDIYAVGATLYKMLTGTTPIPANQLAAGEELDPLPDNISENTKAAVEAAMQLRKNHRPQSIAEFRAILHKPKQADSEPTSEKKSENEDTDIVVPMAEPTPEPIIVPEPQPIPTPEPPVPFPQPGPNPPVRKKKNILPIIMAFCIAAIVGALIILLFTNDRPSEPEPNDTEQVEPVIATATNMSFTNSKGTQFVYTGALDEKGAPHGEGKGVYAEGTYEGEYVHGIREGKGKYVTKDGSNTFVGTYKDDQYSEGRLLFSDGSFYTGTFKNNNLDNGKYYDKNGQLQYNVVNGKYKSL